MGVAARVDQLSVHMKPCSGLTHATFQHVRHPKRITDLARIPLAAILHETGATDHLEVGYLRQLGQNVVLDTVGEGGILFVVAQIFKDRKSTRLNSSHSQISYAVFC